MFKKLSLFYVLGYMLVSVQSACDADSKPIQCDSEECGKFDLCALDETDLECPETQPYCVKGKTSDYCSAQIDLTNAACEEESSEFECTSPGYFPDPHSCTKYHLCYTTSTGDLKSDDKECGTNGKQEYYNSKSKACLPMTAPTTQCITLRCSSANAGFYVYQPDDQLYYSCLEKTVEADAKYSINMFRCAQGETFVSAKGCWYKCPGVNLYPHENKSKYYRCKFLNGDYEVESCPGNSVFNPTTKKCDLAL